MNTIAFERNGFLYLVGDVSPITLKGAEIDELAFAETLRKSAPNENLMWLRGQYVEGDTPNENGQTWSSKELAIKSFTPVMMPVTVMHDPRTAVGLIADTKLRTPEADGVPRTRIDTVLGLWAHRFPEIAEEVALNHTQGTLMQSMECTIGSYDCLECGRGFVKLPQGAERAGWCDHMNESAERGEPVRRLLRDINFTGTGLIMGTRNGARGALSTAHLEIAEEVAEFHERAKSDRRITRRTSHMDPISVPRSEYDEMKAALARVTELAAKVTTLEAEVVKVTALETKLEAAEIAQKTAEDALAAETAKREGLEEAARTATLSSDRLAKLGTAFTAAIAGTSAEPRLAEQAKTFSDEDWTARLVELAELTKVQPDEAGPAAPAGTVTAEETARTQLGGTAGATAPSGAAVSTVLSGLFRQVRPQSATPAKK